MEGEEVNIEELAANLSTYKDQLQQVRKILNDDPKNSEFLDMEKELVEVCTCVVMASLLCLVNFGCDSGLKFMFFIFSLIVVELLADYNLVYLWLKVIALTEELLATAKQNDSSSGFVTRSSGEASPNMHLSGSSFDKPRFTPSNGDKFPLGTKVQAVWSEDGEWYEGTVEAHTSNGYYVRYDGWGNKEEVDPDNVRPVQEGTADPLLEAERIAVAAKDALKRKVAQAATKDFQSWTVPPKLQIDPNDPEDVKAAKRKKIHAFKSKMRMEAKEVTQNKRQNAWQQFQTTKGKAKKVGFFSGRKRESIFKSPEDPFGKVGVTGSGKGLTEFQKREKHLHLKGANMESADD